MQVERTNRSYLRASRRRVSLLDFIPVQIHTARDARLFCCAVWCEKFSSKLESCTAESVHMESDEWDQVRGGVGQGAAQSVCGCIAPTVILSLSGSVSLTVSRSEDEALMSQPKHVQVKWMCKCVVE